MIFVYFKRINYLIESQEISIFRFSVKIYNIDWFFSAHDTGEKVFYAQLIVVQGSLNKRDIVILMGDLNTMIGFDNTLLGHMMRKHGLGDRNANSGRFVDFCNFHHVVIGGTLFEHSFP